MRKKISAILILILVVSVFLPIPGIADTAYAVKKPNTQGNIKGNLSNSGFATIQDDIIYFTNFTDQGKIYKMKAGDSTVFKVADIKGNKLNVVGKYIYTIYQSNIYRLELDGKNPTKLLGDTVNRMLVKDGWIYYVSETAPGLWKCDLDGKQAVQLINNKTVQDFYITTAYIFFDGYAKTEASEGNHLMRTGFDGKNETILMSGSPQGIEVDGNSLYFKVGNPSKGYKLLKTDLDGKNSQTLYSGNFNGVMLYDGFIYFKELSSESYTGPVYRIKPDGSGKTIVVPDSVYFFNIIGGYVYYNLNPNKPDFFRIKTDGTGKEKFNKDSWKKAD